MSEKMIFFDNASTTRIFPEVAELVVRMGSELFFNPSALYSPALRVREIVKDARKIIAKKMNAEDGEIFFTSCATESNNWVLNSGFKNKKGNIVISAGEHASIYDCANFLKGKGVDVRFAALNNDGTLNLDDLLKKLDANTALVSIIHCSNETGAINPLFDIVKKVRAVSPNCLIHSDGVQAFCKIPVDVKGLDVDFYTVSAHKIGGPKGVGALYINKKNRISPLIYGGGQESGLRSGTENTAGIAGFGEAVRVFNKKYNENFCTFDAKNMLSYSNERAEVREIYDLLKRELVSDGWKFNGTESNSGFILSLSYSGIKSEVLQHKLSDEGVLIGLGSSCSAKTAENRVLAAMGLDKKSIEGSIRLSLSIDSTLDETQTAIHKIRAALNDLKEKMCLKSL